MKTSSTIFNDAVVGISANSEAKLQLAIYYLEFKIISNRLYAKRKVKMIMQQPEKLRFVDLQMIKRKSRN